MRFLLIWVVLQPQPQLQDGFPQTKQPKKLWEFRCRAGRHHPEPPGGIPEAEARGSSSSSLPGVVSHPRAAEVKGGWHLVLNRWQKQQEAKIPRTSPSDVVLGVAFFFFSKLH